MLVGVQRVVMFFGAGERWWLVGLHEQACIAYNK
jgi:hypothetical protein